MLASIPFFFHFHFLFPCSVVPLCVLECVPLCVWVRSVLRLGATLFFCAFSSILIKRTSGSPTSFEKKKSCVVQFTSLSYLLVSVVVVGPCTSFTP